MASYSYVTSLRLYLCSNIMPSAAWMTTVQIGHRANSTASSAWVAFGLWNCVNTVCPNSPEDWLRVALNDGVTGRHTTKMWYWYNSYQGIPHGTTRRQGCRVMYGSVWFYTTAGCTEVIEDLRVLCFKDSHLQSYSSGWWSQQTNLLWFFQPPTSHFYFDRHWQPPWQALQLQKALCIILQPRTRLEF